MWIPQGFVPCGLVLIALMMLLRLIAFDPVSKENEFNGEEHKL
ncbi:hypothetical protein L579_4200 [Pantoea sp. AS-PWVM4]|nr:hypothetical protein L579_4200 [Pantoea sp. AS-PWVM4]